MHCETVSTLIKAPHEKTFRYLSSVENLPAWATEFCRRLESVNGRHYVESPQGRVRFDIRSDEQTGVVDFLAGPTDEQMMRWPARVVGLPTGDSLILFTCLHEPGVSEDVFRAQVESLEREMSNVRAMLE